MNFQRFLTEKALFRFHRNRALGKSAEEEGFEPPVPCGTTVFKTAAFDHSAISPGAKVDKFLLSAISQHKKQQLFFRLSCLNLAVIW